MLETQQRRPGLGQREEGARRLEVTLDTALCPTQMLPACPTPLASPEWVECLWELLCLLLGTAK